MKETDWKSRLEEYLLAPQQAWGRPDERQVVKLNSVFQVARKKYGLNERSLVEAVIHAVGARDHSAKSPVYLSNLGGCGSHWISRMLSQASGLVDAGEVYLPVPWYASFLELPRETSARVLDGIELAHSLLYNGTPGRFLGARVINSAHGYEKIKFHRRLRPGAVVIHLARDPRDRTMSVSFRKEEFRNYEASGASDREYLLSKAVRSLTAWRRYEAMPEKADIEVTYEAFRKDAAGQLWKLLDRMGVAPAKSVASAVAYRNSPEYLRSGAAKKSDVGNLDQGGAAKSWRALPRDFRSILHTTTAPALVGQGYALCECFPEGLDGGLSEDSDLAATVAGLDLDGLYVDFRERGKTEWLGIASVDLSRVERIRIRPRGKTFPVETLDRIRPWVTDLCAAGIAELDSDALNHIGRLPALLGMDLARTGVSSVPQRMNFPSLKTINISGTKVDADDSALEGMRVVKDY